jgi:hypothetical protein
MTKRILIGLASLAVAATTASAQNPRPLELGVDAGVAILLDDDPVILVQVPVHSLRVGFPIGTRTSLEPKLSFSMESGRGNTTTEYQAALGLLYHLGSSRYPGAYHRAGLYVRPFAGIVGVSISSIDFEESDGFLGLGIGLKMPLVSRLSSRFEANLAHRFGDGDGTELGLLAGLSFFTR